MYACSHRHRERERERDSVENQAAPHVRTHTRTYARTHARTHIHTHTHSLKALWCSYECNSEKFRRTCIASCVTLFCAAFQSRDGDQGIRTETARLALQRSRFGATVSARQKDGGWVMKGWCQCVCVCVCVCECGVCVCVCVWVCVCVVCPCASVYVFVVDV